MVACQGYSTCAAQFVHRSRRVTTKLQQQVYFIGIVIATGLHNVDILSIRYLASGKLLYADTEHLSKMFIVFVFYQNIQSIAVQLPFVVTTALLQLLMVMFRHSQHSVKVRIGGHGLV